MARRTVSSLFSSMSSARLNPPDWQCTTRLSIGSSGPSPYDLDRIRKHEINRPDLPHGRIDSGKNYVAWLRIWGSLLEDCRARLEYLRRPSQPPAAQPTIMTSAVQ